MPKVEEVKTARNFFDMNEVEVTKANDFIKKHPYSCGKGKSDFRVRYTATGVGTKIVVKCMGCKAKLDVSDYASW